MFLEVVSAEYIREYIVKVNFNTGECKLVDLKDSLNGPVFEPLKDQEFFRHFSIHYNTIEWQNGADFAPEYLYRVGKTLEPLLF